MAYRLTIRAGIGARALLGLLLLAIHLLVLDRLTARSDRVVEAPRLQVVYLREMALAEPPTPSPLYRAPEPRLIEPPDRPASWLIAPDDAAALAFAAMPASAPVVEQSAAADAAADSVEPPFEDTAAAALADTSTASSETAPDPATEVDIPADPPAFVWPASTRLSYVLTGNYRGSVHGSAQVEWVNAAPRYQVNLDVTVGLPFAPLFKREMRSDGRFDQGGLHPRHYMQQSKLAFQPLRRIGLAIGERAVIADDGRQLPIGFETADTTQVSDHRTTLQDSASQFVQLTYLFTTRPQLLTPGTRIGFPLLLPGGVRDWAYEVGQQQTIHTHFGAIDAFHVKTAPGLTRGRDQLLAEAWFAPRLAYLPVRLRIEQHAELYLDMILERVPQIAAP